MNFFPFRIILFAIDASIESNSNGSKSENSNFSMSSLRYHGQSFEQISQNSTNSNSISNDLGDLHFFDSDFSIISEIGTLGNSSCFENKMNQQKLY